MSDESAVIPATVEWDMPPQEARDLSRAQANASAVQAQFAAVANAFAKRTGLPDGTKVRYDIDACVWRRE